MCHNRIMGFHVVRSTRPTVYVYPQFTVDPASRFSRTEEHVANVPQYPDGSFYMNLVQCYFYRKVQLRYLRVGQFLRYFALHKTDERRKALAMRTDENTIRYDGTPACPTIRRIGISTPPSANWSQDSSWPV